MATALYLKEWFIKAPWGRICIVAWGHCLHDPILLCHGECDSAISFKPLMNYLPLDFYYVAMEFPGQGKSDPFPPGMPISVWDLVYVIELVRKHFRWDKFGYMGHSLACVVGRLYDLVHRDKLNRVIELDHVKLGFPNEISNFDKWYDKCYVKYFEKYDALNSRADKSPTYTWDEAIDKLVKLRGLTPETARATIERCSEPTKNDRIRFTFDQRCKAYVFPPLTPEHLKQLYIYSSTPTLGILADNSIKRGLYDLTPFLKVDTDYYRVRIVSGGHDVHIVHPDRCALFICQFLKYGLEGLERRAKL